MRDARSGAGAQRGDLALAGHVPIRRLSRRKCAPLRHLSPWPTGQSRPVRTFGQTAGSATRRGRAPGNPRSGQPWRAFQRGFRLLSTNTLRPRRTTTDPAFCFNARSEFLAFIVHRPVGPSSLPLQVVETATIFLRSKFPACQDPCDQSRHAATGTVGRAAAWRSRSSTAPVAAHAADGASADPCCSGGCQGLSTILPVFWCCRIRRWAVAASAKG